MKRNPPRLGKAEAKYLDRHAEAEAGCGATLAKDVTPYSAVVVIPCFGEYESLLETLASVPRRTPGKPLVVLVINQRNDSPEWASVANRKLLTRLRSHPDYRDPPNDLGPGVGHYTSFDHDLVLIDRTQPGLRLPKRQGVGLARKIGADFALGLWGHGGLASEWIHCTDADARLPADYFARCTAEFPDGASSDKPPAPAALLHDFRHTVDGAQDGGIAILQYELFLRYYVLGLRSAGSPYAFHSIGSTLAINTRAYAQVRGFPRREAAEDFHLLAKLAKVGRIHPMRGEPIVLSGRASTRVPFGTGHAVGRGWERAERGESFPAYDPRNFAWLGVWLATLESLAETPSASMPSLMDATARETEVDPVQLRHILGHLGIFESIEKALQKRGDTLRSLNECFDALATLKLIHALRDEVHSDVSLERALGTAEFLRSDRVGDFNCPTSLEEHCARLAKREFANH